MKRYLLIFIGIFALAACSQEPENTPVAPPLTAQAASESVDFAKAAASSPIASQILNSPQEQDILKSSREAMLRVTASDIAEFQSLAEQGVAANSASDVSLPPLPQACSQYYQRVEQCFSRQPDSEGLLNLNDELRTELAVQQSADEQTCQALNASFNGVARNLGCE